ncbi:hypothetical protein D5S17_01960 [Pseudonocardiaceae bacterium YIM PH 21723]|nr:hypothetical protein D5S17_01960 [Pseudonocardiaceae bacterium YIM PH 21723]
MGAGKALSYTGKQIFEFFASGPGTLPLVAAGTVIREAGKLHQQIHHAISASEKAIAHGWTGESGSAATLVAEGTRRSAEAAVSELQRQERNLADQATRVQTLQSSLRPVPDVPELAHKTCADPWSPKTEQAYVDHLTAARHNEAAYREYRTASEPVIEVLETAYSGAELKPTSSGEASFAGRSGIDLGRSGIRPPASPGVDPRHLGLPGDEAGSNTDVTQQASGSLPALDVPQTHGGTHVAPAHHHDAGGRPAADSNALLVGSGKKPDGGADPGSTPGRSRSGKAEAAAADPATGQAATRVAVVKVPAGGKKAAPEKERRKSRVVEDEEDRPDIDSLLNPGQATENADEKSSQELPANKDRSAQ